MKSLNSYSLISDLKYSEVLKRAALILAGAFIIALSSYVKIYLPFNPVPVTFQTAAVIGIGLAFNRKTAAASVLIYITGGMAGLPFFAGGTSGLLWLLGPTGGYILGFLPAAYAAGLISEKYNLDSFIKLSAAVLVSESIIFTTGLTWLSFFTDKFISLGLIPFIPGELIKIILISAGFSLINKKDIL